MFGYNSIDAGFVPIFFGSSAATGFSYILPERSYLVHPLAWSKPIRV